jgi:hypothetical protein
MLASLWTLFQAFPPFVRMNTEMFCIDVYAINMTTLGTLLATWNHRQNLSLFAFLLMDLSPSWSQHQA